MILWFQLTLCLGVIGMVGWHLSRNGDIIAEKPASQRPGSGCKRWKSRAMPKTPAALK